MVAGVSGMNGYSFTEVEGVLTKAARGSGAGVAHAARFAKAAALALASDEGADLVKAALADLPNGVIRDHAICIQRYLADAGKGTVILPNGDALWVGYIDSLPYKSVETPRGEIAVYIDVFAKPVRPPRVFISDENMAKWQALAAKTYVPETEQSRLGGAGAGLNDND